MLDDYLATEALMIERARNKVQSAKHVLTAPDLQQVKQGAVPTPSLIVMYAGDRLGQSSGHGQGQEVFQRWALSVCVRNVKGQRSGDGTRRDAGPMISDVIRAFQGWTPQKGLRPLVRSGPPAPPGYDKGYAFFPLLFELQMMTIGSG